MIGGHGLAQGSTHVIRESDPMARSGSASWKLGIVGSGSVGTTLAYAVLLRGSASEVAIFDIRAARVEAEALDLAHGSLYAGLSLVSGSNDPRVLADSDVIVVTAGAKQQPGQSRLELARGNARMLQRLMPTLVEQAPDAIFVIITNPADVMTVVAQRCTGLPFHRIFSSGTMLDSSRLRWELGRELGVATASVHAMILGEHGDSQFPLWSQARIGPVPIRDWVSEQGEPVHNQQLDRIADSVKGAAARVIAGKGATNFAIGLSGARIVEAIVHDEGVVLPVSSMLEGYRGISGVALSVPTIIGSSGIIRLLEVPMDDDEIEHLQASAEILEVALRNLEVGAANE